MEFVQIDLNEIGSLLIGNAPAVFFVVGTVSLLRFVGFVESSNQKRMAVVLAAIAAAGLWSAGEIYPQAQPWLALFARAYLFVVFSPVLYALGIETVRAAYRQLNGNGNGRS